MSPEPARLPLWAFWLVRVQTALAVLAAAVIVAFTVADVVMRYGFDRPIPGAYDMVQAMLVLLVFHGLGAVFDRRSNITIDLIDHLLGRRGQGVLVLAADLVQIAALSLLFWAMLDPAGQAYAYGDRMLELGLSLWVVWGFALSGVAGAVLVALARFSADLRQGGRA